MHIYKTLCDINIYEFLLIAACAAAEYFVPVKELLTLVFVFISIDFFLGVWAARRRGEGIKSVRIWDTVFKTIFALMLVMLGYAFDNNIVNLKLSRIAAGFICGIELWSILENMSYISNSPMFDLFRKVISDKVKENTGIDLEKENTGIDSESRQTDDKG